jgi:hypothetical protein
MSRRAGARAAWAGISPEHRHAALAAIGLLVALFLPWYEKSAFVLTADGRLVAASQSLSAFAVISYVEGAVMLVAAAVLALVYTRARSLPFHLPGGDGTVIAAGGAWAALLLAWRLFDKPDVAGRAVTVGVQWGWFVAVVLAAGMVASGLRLRAAHRPEPPNPAAEPPPAREEREPHPHSSP